MPLARFALYAAGVQIYLAPTWDHGENWLATLRHIAREGRVVVVGCGTALRMSDVPDRYEFRRLYPEGREWINPGGSAIVDPKGKVIAGPIENVEDIPLCRHRSRRGERREVGPRHRGSLRASRHLRAAHRPHAKADGQRRGVRLAVARWMAACAKPSGCRLAFKPYVSASVRGLAQKTCSSASMNACLVPQTA